MLENEAATGDEVEAQSMDDTIRETLRAIEARDGLPDEVAKGPDEAAEASAGRARDESGRFAPKAEEAPAEAAETSATEPATEAAEPPELAVAPNTWRKEAQAEWATLSPVVRQEAIRREQDFHRGIEQYKQAAQAHTEFQRTVQPYEATLRSLGLEPTRAVGELLAVDHRLRYGQQHEKAAIFQRMAQAYGVDLGTVASVEQPAPVDPNVAALQNQLAQVQQHLQQQQLMGQQQEEATLNSEIAKFRADPAHAHFDAVSQHMAALLQAGLAQTLDDAYAQAVYANPQTRAAVQQQQAKAQREEAQRKADEAKRAGSVNVRSRPAMPQGIPQGQSMEDTIRQELRRITGG